MAVGSVNDQINSLQNQINTMNLATVPNGCILMWSGSIASIPAYWRLCDGSNGTPDLRNRFVVGAGSSYGVNNTGGQDSVTLTVSQMPSHRHALRGSFTAGGYDGGNNDFFRGRQSLSYATSSTDLGMMNYEGGGQSHENRPPYRALCFIMKVSTP